MTSTSRVKQDKDRASFGVLHEPKLDLLVQASSIVELRPGKYSWPEAIIRAIHRLCIRTNEDTITTKQLREEEFENIKLEVGVNEKELVPKTPSRTLSSVLTRKLTKELKILERVSNGVYKVNREALKKEFEKVS